MGPKQKKKKQTILVGMTGRKDSTVAAYLLKKQGFDVVGLGISLFSVDEHVFKPEVKEDEIIDKKKGPKKDIEFFGHCHVPDLREVKAICDSLEISFYAANAQGMFKERVMENVVGTRLAGDTFSPCVFCHKTIIETLVEKAELLKIDQVATGHFAKVQYLKKKESYVLVASDDAENDQSYELSKLGQYELSKLMFPLSDMYGNEVDKVASALGMKYIEHPKKEKLCFIRNEGIVPYVESHAAKSLTKPGQVLKYEDETFVEDHEGIHNYHVGQRDIQSKTNAGEASLEVVDIDIQSGTVLVAHSEKLKYHEVVLVNSYYNPNMDISKPLTGYAKIKFGEDKIPCELYFKNNNTVLLNLTEEQKGQLVSGQTVTVYDRIGRGAKVLASGEVLAYDLFTNLEELKENYDDEEGHDEKDIFGQKDFRF